MTLQQGGPGMVFQYCYDTEWHMQYIQKQGLIFSMSTSNPSFHNSDTDVHYASLQSELSKLCHDLSDTLFKNINSCYKQTMSKELQFCLSHLNGIKLGQD